MPSARKHTIIPGQSGFFHCVSRCVRRARLCGTDPVSGENYDHRRDWMIERLHLITACFAIDVYAYAFMENHYHVVLYVEPDRVSSWSDERVIRQWKKMWNWRRPDTEPDIPENVPTETIRLWRERLADVSWAMRLLNEPIARIANSEDDAKGHFWESRFKCKPLLDDSGLVMCMVYADLNPIKAGIALTPEDSDYTSIQQRIRKLAKQSTVDCAAPNRAEQENDGRTQQPQCHRLLPVSSATPNCAPTLSISLESYIELVETTAEAIKHNLAITSNDVLTSLGIKPSGWIRAVKDFVRLFRTAAGSEDSFTRFIQSHGLSRRQDATARRILFT